MRLNIFPNIEKLAKKDSDLSTKRYSDLRLTNHVIWMSWTVLITFIYFQRWQEITFHFLFLSILCFCRGLLAKDGFLNNLIKRDNIS